MRSDPVISAFRLRTPLTSLLKSPAFTLLAEIRRLLESMNNPPLHTINEGILILVVLGV
jgi:hypothetical protein